MSDSTPKSFASFDLSGTYVHLEDGGVALPVEVTETFWQELMTGEARSDGVARIAAGDGWLVTANRFERDTPMWEMHPEGDELLLMLSGALDVVFDGADGERAVELRAGSACRVPRGTWHRLVVREPGLMLGVTRGKGTQHRPV